ncbi:hypothetical protein OJJOAM_003947 [Cupriavidus sp. H18C1]
MTFASLIFAPRQLAGEGEPPRLLRHPELI